MEENQKKNDEQKINVFVTYSWNNEEHQEKSMLSQIYYVTTAFTLK
jgi:hypothetical protein